MTLCHKYRHSLLLEYFPTSLICIRMIWRVSGWKSDPLLSTHCRSYKIYTPMSSKITNVLKLDQPGKIWLHVTRTDIHCLLSVPWLPFNGEEWLEELMTAYSITSWSTQSSFNQKYSQISSKIINYGQQISLGNVTLCRKDMHSLLLECPPTSLKYIRMLWRVSGMIFDPPMVVRGYFLPQWISNFKQNKQVWTPDQPGKCDTVS